MKEQSKYEFHHACPRNCFSNCTMVSTLENGHLVSLNGDRSHPYTNGKLCAKGYSYIERNEHQDRLKYPYYQKVKGSGKFTQITWKKAFDIILCEMLNIHKTYGSFLPLAFYKGSGNVGVHHYVADHFFSSLGECTRINGSSLSSTGFEAIKYDTGAIKMSNPVALKDSQMIIIWGANPAASNIHLIPFLIEAKVKGAKLVVIDPIYTQTAELADMYIQLRPSTDGTLANLLFKELIEADCYDKEFVEQHSFGFQDYFSALKEFQKKDLLHKCGIAAEAIDLLLSWMIEAEVISHIIGMGLQKHANGGQNTRAIEALAAVHGDIGKKGGGIFFRRMDSNLFKNQQRASSLCSDQKNRFVKINDPEYRIFPSQFNPPIEMMWISCANPVIQEPDPQFLMKFLSEVPFVVTVDLFMTPTAKMSNIVLPTTSHFEEMDMMTSYWHKEITLNEKAINSYYESLSEWNIMREIAIRLKKSLPKECAFPIHSSEEEYLNEQFNEAVQKRYFIKNVSELRNKRILNSPARTVWEKRKFATASGLYQFYSAEAKEDSLPPMPLFVEGPSPTEEFPFWLITPHNPYTFNSQFHFLNLSDEDEAYMEIHPKVAEELSIDEGEVVKIFNDQDSIEIKVVYSHRVPKDILVIYQGWYSDSKVNVNQLVPVLPTDMGARITGIKGTAFYDTFVNIGKL